jgi:hypothetical protein
MGKHMKHLEEAELVEHYYAESPNMGESERHLKACPVCSKRYAELCRVLDAVDTPTAPARKEDYVEQIWQSIGASLPRYEKPKSSWFRFYRPLGWAAACVLLVAVAFVAGRKWERKQGSSVAVAVDPQARHRVVIVVLGDHLDRSERLLVQLNHAEGSDLSALPLRSEARELLASNRLVRQSAMQAGNLNVEASLDQLERLLMELSNEPDTLTEADLDRLRHEMNTDGLLFDIRVLRSRVHSPGPEQQRAPTATKGVPI